MKVNIFWYHIYEGIFDTNIFWMMKDYKRRTQTNVKITEVAILKLSIGFWYALVIYESLLYHLDARVGLIVKL